MTDDELKLRLSRLLPEKIDFRRGRYRWLEADDERRVRDTEWQHVCWLIEQTFTSKTNEYARYVDSLTKLTNFDPVRASWQQRAEVLWAVKGITGKWNE